MARVQAWEPVGRSRAGLALAGDLGSLSLRPLHHASMLRTSRRPPRDSREVRLEDAHSLRWDREPQG